MPGALSIIGLQTGEVQIKEHQRAGRGPGLLRIPRTLASRGWTPWLPTIAWFIDHPEGGILVDTGETARALAPGYTTRWNPYFRLAVRERLTADDEVVSQLAAAGRSPGDVRWLVLTHLHLDHVGGLGQFPDAEVIVSARELGDARGILGQARGYLPQHWPQGFAPRTVSFESGPAHGPFPHSVPLTSDGRVVLLPTPGHTPGHMSVLVRGHTHDTLLAGDTSYTQQLMLDGVADGVTQSPRTAAHTLARIRALAAERPLVYLPTHDPESLTRLAGAEVVPV